MHRREPPTCVATGALREALPKRSVSEAAVAVGALRGGLPGDLRLLTPEEGWSCSGLCLLDAGCLSAPVPHMDTAARDVRGYLHVMCGAQIPVCMGSKTSGCPSVLAHLALGMRFHAELLLNICACVGAWYPFG